ncbi:MAG: hypothetical protein K6T78_08000 [Alicyclobacillus sp.]|nr:hypothetical protein [Alicyclobacillus sp.]
MYEVISDFKDLESGVIRRVGELIEVSGERADRLERARVIRPADGKQVTDDDTPGRNTSNRRARRSG